MSIRTTRYEIFEYWKTKRITSKFEVEEDLPPYDGISVIRDWGEPCCWACGQWIETPVEGTDDFKTIWNYKNQELDRCHIVSKQFGGEDTPENLFLLCPRCHEMSPDTKNKKHFFIWVSKERKEGSTWQREMISNIIKYSKDVTGYELEELLENNYEDVQKLEFKDILKRCALHGRNISLTSIAFETLEE